MRPGSSLAFMRGTGGRRPGIGLGVIAAATAAMPDDVAALAIQLMTNAALTGATYDVDGGQQLLPE